MLRSLLRSLLLILTTPFRLILWPFRQIGRLGKYINRFLTENPEDTPLGDAFQNAVENPLGILEHLNALRKNLMRAVIALAITTAISFTFVQQILEWLAGPLPGGIANLRSIDPTETVGTVMRVALLAGFAIAFPYIYFEIWLLIAPGTFLDLELQKNPKNWINEVYRDKTAVIYKISLSSMVQ